MSDVFLLSLVSGVAIGAVYGLSAYASYRFALDRENRLFMLVVLGGMALRLFVTVLVLVLILILGRVNQGVFLISFMAVFALGLVIEVVFLHRRQQTAARKTD